VKVVKRCISKGGKGTPVGATDTDILREGIKELQKMTTVGAATFLVDVKVHQGKPTNDSIGQG